MALLNDRKVCEFGAPPRRFFKSAVVSFNRTTLQAVLPEALSMLVMKSSWPMPLMMRTSRSFSRATSWGRGW